MRTATAALLCGSLAAIGLLAGCSAGTAPDTLVTDQALCTTSLSVAEEDTLGTTEHSTTSLSPMTSTTVVSAATPVHAWGETVATNKLAVTVEAPTRDDEAPMVKDGQKVIVAVVTITNNGAAAYEYNALYFQLLDSECQPYEAQGYTELPKLVHGFVQPGRSIRGAVAFNLPETAEAATLIFSPIYGAPDQVIWGK